MVLKIPYTFRDFQGNSWIEKEDFSLKANASIANGTVRNEAANVLLPELLLELV